MVQGPDHLVARTVDLSTFFFNEGGVLPIEVTEPSFIELTMPDGASPQESESALLTIYSDNNLIAGEYTVGLQLTYLDYLDESGESALATRTCSVNLTVAQEDVVIFV